MSAWLTTGSMNLLGATCSDFGYLAVVADNCGECSAVRLAKASTSIQELGTTDFM
jgi:hypothetical protein